MTKYYYIIGPIKELEYPDDDPIDGPIFDEFIVTADSEEAALKKHQTHCEELGIELEDINLVVLDEYLEVGEHLFGVEDTIWQPGDSAREAQRDQLVENLTHVHVGILSTIYQMITYNDTPVSTDRVVEKYESNRDHQLDQSKVPSMFDDLIEGDFVGRERKDGVGVYSMTPERVRELRRHVLNQAHLGEWTRRNLADGGD